MGIADQFKDKAKELADQAERKEAGGKRDEAREPSSGRPARDSGRASDRRPGPGPGARGRAQDAADQTRERSER
jgi:hypothetical protein